MVAQVVVDIEWQRDWMTHAHPWLGFENYSSLRHAHGCGPKVLVELARDSIANADAIVWMRLKPCCVALCRDLNHPLL